jgi:chaperonin GroEL (HSP60 family)
LEQFKNDLMNIARTTLSSKILQGQKDYFSKLCVEAVLKLHVNLGFFFLFNKVFKILFIG